LTRLLYLSNCYAPPTSVNVGAAARHYYHVQALRDVGLVVEVITATASTIQTGAPPPEWPEWVHAVDSGVIRGRGIYERARYYLSHLFGGLKIGISLPRRAHIVLASTPTILIAVQGWLLAAWCRARFVLDVRDLWADSLRATRFGRWGAFVRLNEWLEALCYRRADAIVCTTQAQRAEIVRLTRGKVPVTLVPNGVDLDLLRASSPTDAPEQLRALRQQYDRLVVFAGKHSEYTALDTVIEAASLIDDSGVGIVLIGGGYQKTSLVALATELGVGNVHFMDPVPKALIGSCLLLADVLLINYSANPQWSKVLPNKLYDYLYCDIPIVAAVCDGEIGRILRESRSGVRVEPGNPRALAAALQMDFAQTAMNLRGRAYVSERFDRREIVNRFVLAVTSDGGTA
jgi:glycosyltransferase involved in cell wall biosynthesis